MVAACMILLLPNTPDDCLVDLRYCVEGIGNSHWVFEIGRRAKS